MARVTIEDCLQNVDNMYELVHLATKRARQLYKGSDPLVKSKNRIIVTALREIAAGKVLARVSQPSSEDDLPLSN
jgi:DNA-directed RNA polymerase subunit omega